MKRFLPLLLFAVMFASLCGADMAVVACPAAPGESCVPEQAVPSSLTTVVTGTVGITSCWIQIVSGSPTITIASITNSTKPFLNFAATAGTTYLCPPHPVLMTGGFTIQLTNGGSASFSLSYRP